MTPYVLDEATVTTTAPADAVSARRRSGTCTGVTETSGWSDVGWATAGGNGERAINHTVPRRHQKRERRREDISQE